MDNAQVTVTQADREAAARAGLELGRLSERDAEACQKGGAWDEWSLVLAFARHRLERSEPVGCQYPVHGSVTHVRSVECCDFCGHPADTTTPEPVAEIERLRGALVSIARETVGVVPEVLNLQMCIHTVNDVARAALGDAS